MASEYVKTSGHFNHTIVYFYTPRGLTYDKVKKIFTFRGRVIDVFFILIWISSNLQLRVQKRVSKCFGGEMFSLHVLPFSLFNYVVYSHFKFSCFNMYILASKSRTLIPQKFLCTNLNLFLFKMYLHGKVFLDVYEF